MSKRFIGIDISGGMLHLAIASADKGGTMLDQVISRPLENPEDLPGALSELLGPSAGFGEPGGKPRRHHQMSLQPMP